MSADFVFGITSADEPKQYWIEKVNNLSDKIFQDFCESTDWYVDVEETPQSRSEMRGAVVEAIEACYDEKRSDIGWCVLEGKRYVVSGGMTWGDEPTEACRSLWLFDAFKDFIKTA